MSLKVVTVHYPPFMVYHEENGSWTGTCYQILKKLEGDLNLTFEITAEKSGGWGTKSENGSWDGMIGAVMRGEADMAGEHVKTLLFNLKF